MSTNNNNNPQLIGKKQLLAWASEVVGVEASKYDDLRDGMIPLLLFKALFINAVPADVASNLRAQLSMTPAQRNSRQNWTVLQSVLRVGGIPPHVWDRRAVSAAHPKACYNFLVMAYFLHKLRNGGDFSVDFALPIEAELSTFLQSPRSLEIVSRANSIRPVSTATTTTRATAAAESDPQQQQQNTDSGFSAGPSSSYDNTPVNTPRGGRQHQSQQQQPMFSMMSSVDELNQQQQQQFSPQPPPSVFAAANFALHDASNSGGGVSPRDKTNHNNSNNSSSHGGMNKKLQQIKESGWRYPQVDTNQLGEALIERLRLENSRMQDAVHVHEEHSRATQQYCEAQLRFCREQFEGELQRTQTAAGLQKLQLEAQAALSASMVSAATEARLRDLERRIELEKKEMAWATFADDAMPPALPLNDRNNNSELAVQWLSAQLDAARKAAATERQHRIALENSNAHLREQTAKFGPLLNKLVADTTEMAQQVSDRCDAEAIMLNTESALLKVKESCEAQFQSKITALQKELDAISSSSGNTTNDNSNNATTGSNNNKAMEADLYTTKEQLARTKEQLARAERSAAVLRDVLHRNCVSAVQKLDLANLALDPGSEELRRGVIAFSHRISSATSSATESAAAAHVAAIGDIVSRTGSSSADVVDAVRDEALKLVTLQQVLEARVESMATALRRAAEETANIENQAAAKVLQLQAQVSEMQSRHAAETQQLAANKTTENAQLQSELQLLRQQLAREQLEHSAATDRLNAAHSAMSQELHSQIHALRLAIAEVRRAESLHLQRDALWSQLADNLSLVASPSAAAEAKYRAETKANQLRDELRKNAADLKANREKGSNSSSGYLNSNNNNNAASDVSEAVREAVQHSHAQLEQALGELRGKNEELRRLEIMSKSLQEQLEGERQRAQRNGDSKLIAEEELSQTRSAMDELKARLVAQQTAEAHSKQALETLVENAVTYIEDLANQLAGSGSSRSGASTRPQLSTNTATGTRNHNRSGSSGKPNDNNNSNNSRSNSLFGAGSAFAGISVTGRRSGNTNNSTNSNSILGSGAAAEGNNSALSGGGPSSGENSSSPPRLVAPKFSPIELSPPKASPAKSSNAAAAASNISSVNSAADAAVDDFAKKQKEILAKYGIK